MLENVELVLAIFLVFYVLILIYDFFIIIENKSSIKTLNKRKKTIIKYLNDNNKLIKKLRNINYLYALISMLDEEVKVGNKTINEILNSKKYEEVINSLSKIYSNKEEIEKTYFAFALSKLNVPSGSIDFLFDVLYGNSLYGIEDAIKALYSTNNPDLIVKAFKIISHNTTPYSSKLITDGMLEYKGDKQELANKLYDEFNSFNNECQIAFIEFFKRINFDISEDIIETLVNSHQEKELEISMIRYFSKIKNDNAYKLFLDRIKNNYYDEFEYDVVMIQTLSNYPKKETIDVLSSKLSDTNYYIRLNSCQVLNKITDISKLKVTDKYAIDIIEYIKEEGK